MTRTFALFHLIVGCQLTAAEPPSPSCPDDTLRVDLWLKTEEDVRNAQCVDEVVWDVWIDASGEVSLPALRSFGGSLNVTSKSQTSAIDLPMLEEGAWFTLWNSRVQSVRLPKLRKLTGSLWFAGNDRLTEIHAPVLEQVAGMTIEENDSLRTFAFPRLERVATSTRILNNHSLAEWSLDAVSNRPNRLTVRGNADDADCRKLAATYGPHVVLDVERSKCGKAE